MIYNEELFLGKNGIEYILRSPQIEDAEKLIAYLKEIAAETEYGISYPEEINFSIEDEEKFINKFNNDKNSIMISVFYKKSLVGNASLTNVLDKKKTKHRATFGIAILKSEHGQGLGEKILTELIKFAQCVDYEQIELEVVSSNLPAISLYKKKGFVVYGERPHSFKQKSGKYSNELLMVLNL